MSDETNTTPEQQDNSSPGQQAGDTQTTDWEARFKGLQRKYNALVEQHGDLESRIGSLSSEKEQLESRIDTLSTEKDSINSQNQSKIDELTQSLAEKEETLSKLTTFQKKVQIARDMGHPELVKVVDSVPDSDDEEVIKKHFKSILDLTSDLVKAREEQLSEGLSPGGVDSDGAPLPNTHEGWQELINDLPLGSRDRAKAQDQYFQWTREG
jgi:chromosome segregation ATPase